MRSPRSTNIQRILTALPLLFTVIPFYIIKKCSLSLNHSLASFSYLFRLHLLLCCLYSSLSLLSFFCCNYFLSVLSCKVRFSLVSIVSHSLSLFISHRFLLLLYFFILFNNMYLLFCFCFIDIFSRKVD
jgi:hypothetical protein